MKKWTHIATVAVVALACSLGTGQAQAAEDIGDHHKNLTPEQRQQLQSFRNDLQQVRIKEMEIREVMNKLRTQSRELRVLLPDVKDKSLKEQVDTEMKSFHDKLKTSYHLHKQDLELSKQIHGARIKGDLSKLRELAPQMLKLKTQQLELLQAADKQLHAELVNVRQHLSKQ